MTRNPHAGALRHFKPQRIEDKRGKALTDELIEHARNYKMTPQERFEQRVSFIYGQQDFDNPNPRTKEQIRQHMIDTYGSPA